MKEIMLDHYLLTPILMKLCRGFVLPYNPDVDVDEILRLSFVDDDLNEKTLEVKVVEVEELDFNDLNNRHANIFGFAHKDLLKCHYNNAFSDDVQYDGGIVYFVNFHHSQGSKVLEDLKDG